MAVTTALNAGSMMLWSPILPLILRDLGASDFSVSACVAVWTSVSALSQLLGGRWGDRFGRSPTMVYPTYLAAISIGIAAFMPSWIPFAFVFLFWYASNGIQTPVYSAVIGEAVPPALRGHAFGLVEFVICIGVVLGPLAGAALLPLVGARGLFLITAAVFSSTALARHLLLRETRPALPPESGFRFRQILQGRLRLILLILVAYNVVSSMSLWGPFISLHGSGAMGLTKSQINVFFAVGSVASVVMSLVAGRAVARWGSYRVMSWATLGLGTSLLVWSFQRHLAGIAVGILAISAFFEISMVANDAFRVTSLPDTIRSSALGALGTVSSLASALALPLAGYLRATLPLAPFVLGGITSVVLFLAVEVLAAHDRAALAVQDRTAQQAGARAREL